MSHLPNGDSEMQIGVNGFDPENKNVNGAFFRDDGRQNLMFTWMFQIPENKNESKPSEHHVTEQVTHLSEGWQFNPQLLPLHAEASLSKKMDLNCS